MCYIEALPSRKNEYLIRLGREMLKKAKKELQEPEPINRRASDIKLLKSKPPSLKTIGQKKSSQDQYLIQLGRKVLKNAKKDFREQEKAKQEFQEFQESELVRKVLEKAGKHKLWEPESANRRASGRPMKQDEPKSLNLKVISKDKTT